MVGLDVVLDLLAVVVKLAHYASPLTPASAAPCFPIAPMVTSCSLIIKRKRENESPNLLYPNKR